MNESADPRPYTKEEFESYLSLIEQKLLNSDDSYMHAVLSINDLLQKPDAPDILDEGLAKRAREVWAKIKSMGIVIADPPLLFGLPNDKEGAH